MTYFQRKEANRLYWKVKGHLVPESWGDKDVLEMYESYFRRLWGNHEQHIHEVGFEAAWAQRQAKIFQKNMKKNEITG